MTTASLHFLEGLFKLPVRAAPERNQLMLEIVTFDVHHFNCPPIEFILFLLADAQRIENGILPPKVVAVIHSE